MTYSKRGFRGSSWESKVARSRVANFGFKDENYYEEDGSEQNNNGSTENPLQYSAEYAQNASTNPPAAASLPSLATGARPPPPQQQPQQQHPQQNYGGAPPPRMIPDPSTLTNQYQMMQPPPPQADSKPQNNGLLNLQLPGLPRPPNLPQNDGACDQEEMTTEQIDAHIEQQILGQPDDITFSASSSFSGEQLSLDSLPDSVKQLMKDARERAIKAGAISSRIAQLDGEGDEEEGTGGDDDINSDLDDTDDEENDADGGEEIEHIILCLYDKVTRTKNKWKCVLKDGIMLVNGRDYLFHRANGDFEW
ncbi:hypothetical protein K501DRAFT_322547 [Backusella circina FSU 941]|nr:hypothetical protein K501DRAFT_322547 [Backusella circina FSU 941]